MKLNTKINLEINEKFRTGIGGMDICGFYWETNYYFDERIKGSIVFLNTMRIILTDLIDSKLGT